MLLRFEAAGLFALAVALAVPVPAALARSQWPQRDPRIGLVCWQAVGLAGGLSILGAGLTLAASSTGRRWLPGVAALPSRWSHLGVVGWAGASLTAMVALWLGAVAMRSGTRVLLARRAHRLRLDAVADVVDNRSALPGDGGHPSLGPAAGERRHADLPPPDQLRFLDTPTAVAYCLPGLRPRIVISRGATAALERGELQAVLAHEQAHARGRHDLVVQPFVAWHETFPFLPTAATALGAVQLLVEMLADDHARRRCDPAQLRHALKRLGDERFALGAGGRPPDPKPARSTRRAPHRSPAAAAPVGAFLAYLAAITLVTGPPALLIGK